MSKHETERAREIGIDNTILRVQVGSGLHGTNVLAQVMPLRPPGAWQTRRTTSTSSSTPTTGGR